MTPEQYIKAQLAAFAHREAAHHGGSDNMLAVAFVIRNRQRAGWEGGNWMRILDSAPAFCGTVYPPSSPDLRDLTFKMFLTQVEDIYSGMMPDKFTRGALFYCELNQCRNEWFADNILRDPTSHPRVATVGNVSFFT
jgi:hypothetical protein